MDRRSFLGLLVAAPAVAAIKPLRSHKFYLDFETTGLHPKLDGPTHCCLGVMCAMYAHELNSSPERIDDAATQDWLARLSSEGYRPRGSNMS